MLRWRLILGAALIAGLAALGWADAHADRPGSYLGPLALLAAALAAGEMLRMFRVRGAGPAAWTAYLGALLPVALSCLAVVGHERPEPGLLAVGVVVAMLLAFVGEMRRYESPGASIVNVAQAALAILYVGGLLGMLVQLRLVGAFKQGQAATLVPLLSMIAIVKFSDIGQYATGRLFGRHKLAPRISPGKTWEGAVGGISLATIVGAVGLVLVLRGRSGLSAPSLLMAGLYAASLGVVGLVGDLAESLLKRDAGVKDSSDWMPGFGGVLDLLDSLLFAAPVAYLWWASGLI